MKKTLIILSVLVGAIFLGGCGNSNPATETIGENQTIPSGAPGSDIGSKVGAAANSLKDLVGMGKKMECDSTDNGVTTKIFIEGTKYKSTTESKEFSMTGIFDGDTFYSWNTKTKAGTKMTMACMQEIGKDMPKAEGKDNSEITSTDKLIEEQAKKNNCKETAENIDFTLPSDISFVDQCAMMKGMTQNLKDMKLPDNIKIPTQ